ncbi:hypothetical protein [Halorussus pelagicus]|uniref:hypothetical protein n=1 Tax=Halorussus pelagicus TaxID=2505977 RepID=UPI000FFB9AEC|nr:hypothetical protein [Halorussus pelagicus]
MLSRRAVLRTLFAGSAASLAGCQRNPESSLETRTQRPPQKIRASIPKSIDQTFDATVEEWSDSGIKIGVTTTLTGATEDIEPSEMVVRFNEDNELQGEAVVSNPSFGDPISVTLEGEIGQSENDVSLSSHTEFKPSGSLSIHYTKLLPKK